MADYRARAAQRHLAVVALAIDRDLDAKRLAGTDEAAVPKRPHAAEDHPPTSSRVEQASTRLHHRFDHEDPGQDREAWEVVAEILLRRRDRLHRDDPVGLLLEDLIDQLELHGAAE